MMFSKAVLVTVFAVAQVAVATPPACLLAAVKYVSVSYLWEGDGDVARMDCIERV
jgi:hypothetical protein